MMRRQCDATACDFRSVRMYQRVGLMDEIRNGLYPFGGGYFCTRSTYDDGGATPVEELNGFPPPLRDQGIEPGR